MKKIVIVGAGIGGLAAALACARAGGMTVQVLEQADTLSEVGAGIQLGPNAVRRLVALGVGDAVRRRAGHPRCLEVRDAVSQRLIGSLPLGATARSRYGEDYLTIHRADLQALLMQAALAQPTVHLQLSTPVNQVRQDDTGVEVVATGRAFRADVAVVANGVWSGLRQQLLGDGPPRRLGHIALRTLIPAAQWPRTLARDTVTAWLGERMHAVAYPVRGGDDFNLVIIVHEGDRIALDDQGDRWNGAIEHQRVADAVADTHAVLRELVAVAPGWKFWALHGRPPVADPHEMVRGRVGLLGDAAHPMVPYLAQGAAMAIEDAHALGEVLGRAEADALPLALTRWADMRWERVSRVQARSLRNGRIFHATGFLRLGRDWSMRILGERLIDLPWLYGG